MRCLYGKSKLLLLFHEKYKWPLFVSQKLPGLDLNRITSFLVGEPEMVAETQNFLVYIALHLTGDYLHCLP